MGKKVLVTGVGGFIGSHLVEFLLNKGFKVYGSYYKPTVNMNEINKRVILEECDMRDNKKVKESINKIKPDYIFHLAAQSYPAVSWKKPRYTMQSNVIGTINLFEAVKKLKCRVLIAGSSGEYGFVEEERMPMRENYNLQPLHPYGVSKVAQDLLAYQYFKNFGIDCFTVRIFNTTGPRKVNDVCSDFASKIVKIENENEKVLRVGNLEPRRAIIDVRDLVKALWLAMEKCEAGESYNISGSEAYKIEDLLEMFLKLSKVKIKVEEDKKLIRPTDEPLIIGSNEKFVKKTGWKQEVKIEQTLKDMLEYFRGVENG